MSTTDYQTPIKQWWGLVTSDRHPKADPSRLVSVAELPIYAEDKKSQLYFIESEPLPLQREFSTIRRAWQEEYNRVAERFSLIDHAVTGVQNTAFKVQRYVEDEWSVIPKAGAITLGGMAGLVLGMRRGAFGRIFTSATGMATMTAFCYPKETVDLIRGGLASVRSEWTDFQKSPHPPNEKKPDLSPPKK
ncbi:unnamed protein product, partial [Mesorhabditis belari]|uniref:MICOS complex subunit n=1 Tax=Mesorhabditis belari TaxID=2138241 RepID=A0AAF3FNE2_9BILA